MIPLAQMAFLQFCNHLQMQNLSVFKILRFINDYKSFV